MKIAVLGTGMVGKAIATKGIELGHLVMMGSRSASNEKAAAWVAENGDRASSGTFADAAACGEIVFNCTGGQVTLDVLRSTGNHLSGKILIDISNPLDFSHGMPPTLSVCNNTSLGEQVQELLPDTFVVKTLNTLNCNLMVNPRSLADGDHHLFLSGNDGDAKARVSALLQTFGWRADRILDLGDITTARGTEMWLPLWLRIYGVAKTGAFNLKLMGIE
ncbi:MAG: NAD(P)-binding domain-containing protein [Bacteroidetes bacterium]|nr:NAD(P)-binding domain-containing protein [Bacteroidota bacterium]